MRKRYIITILIFSLFFSLDRVSAVNMDYTCGTVLGEKAIVTIKFNTNGGSRLNDRLFCYDCGTETFQLPTPKKNGYKFIGWYANKSLTKPVNTTFSKKVDGKKIDYIVDDIGCNSKRMHFNLYAKWEKDEKCKNTVLSNVTINFETGTDEKLDPLKICASCNDVKISLPIPSSDDEIFIGWYLEKDLLTKIPDGMIYASNIYSEMNLEFDNSEKCSNNMHGKLYARWIKKDELKQYIIDAVDNNFFMINDLIEK